MDELQALWDAEDWPGAARRVRELALEAEDYTAVMSLVRWRKRLAPHLAPTDGNAVRVALLGNATTEFLAPIVELLLEAHGLRPSVHLGGYDTLAWECLQPDSGTAAFGPDVIAVVQSPLGIQDWPAATAAERDAGAWAQGRVDGLLSLFESAHANMGCDIIADTLHRLPLRPHGSLAPRLAADRNRLIGEMNRQLAARAPDYVVLHDVDMMSSVVGLDRWVDYRWWYQAKQPMSFRSGIEYARSLTRLIASIFRGSRKCLVLDLDNTLWGGVVGDDGVSGLAVGAGNPVGEAFVAFQDYLKQLKDRGIILTVCSKNELDNARAPFTELPDMVLSLDDFAAFRASWDPKPDNIRAIAQDLNIGLDAMVFVDDNPAERAIVRQLLPEVAVVELTDDPSDYARILDAAGWFEVPRLSQEDTLRTQQYQANTQREELRSSADDYGTYLQSLEQRAVIRPFEDRHLDRITQLVNKTNQFNLTTRRENRSAIEARMRGDNYLTAYVRLGDRFGDNGLISVWYGHMEGTVLEIEQWLMSCRVFNRGIEHHLMNYVAEQAKSHGIDRVCGRYIPTAKNKLVADLYERLGFTCTVRHEDGSTDWELALADYRPTTTFVESVEDY
jgi:FkbH-like protein